MLIKETDPDIFALIIDLLEKNKILIMKCDTIYGIIGAAPDTEEAIREAKNRESGRQFILLIHDESWVQRFTDDRIPSVLKKYWPGPLTLVFRGKESETAALRVPSDPFLLKILSDLGKPLFSTSVNLSSKPHLKSIREIVGQFSQKVDCIVDSGDEMRHIPSTIVDTTIRPFRILRQGSLVIPATELDIYE